MALALLKLIDQTTRDAIFEADIGSNTFYQYVIGQDRRRVDGFEFVESVRHESTIRANEANSIIQSTFPISIPLTYFDADMRFVQLRSYKSRDRRAPAWSKVLPVVVDHSLKARMMSKVHKMSERHTRPSATFEPPRSVSFNLAENRLSSTMFWDQLFQIAGALIPIGSQLVGQVVNREAGTNLDSSDIANVLQTILNAAQQGQSGSGSSGNAANPNGANAVNGASASSGTNAGSSTNAQAAQSLMQSRFVSMGPRAISYKQLRQAGGRRYMLSRGQDGGVISGSALLGLISTLAPSVFQVLGPLFESAPQLAESYLDAPLRLYNAIAEANRREQQLTNEQINSMLAAGNQALFYTLLEDVGGMNLAKRPLLAVPPRAPISPVSPTPVASQSLTRNGASGAVEKHVNVKFIQPKLVDMNGQRKPLYLRDGEVTVELVIEPDAELIVYPIAKAVVVLRVKNSLDGEVLFERQYKIREIQFGTPIPLTLDASDVSALPHNTDLLVSADIVWLDEEQRAHQSARRATQPLFLTGRYVLKSVGHRQGRAFALKNPHDYRAFWHLVWEGGSTTHGRWELETKLRYYYQLVVDATNNGRIDTKFRVIAEESKDTGNKVVWSGLMKSGMELAVGELNKLLVNMQETPWTDEELDALASETFAKSVNQQATTEVKLRGRKSELGNIWVFPILDLVSISVHEVVEVAQDGQAAKTNTVDRLFPVPIQSVFVGLKSDN